MMAGLIAEMPALRGHRSEQPALDPGQRRLQRKTCKKTQPRSTGPQALKKSWKASAKAS
jgi:hypothetical protein